MRKILTVLLVFCLSTTQVLAHNSAMGPDIEILSHKPTGDAESHNHPIEAPGYVADDRPFGVEADEVADGELTATEVSSNENTPLGTRVVCPVPGGEPLPDRVIDSAEDLMSTNYCSPSLRGNTLRFCSCLIEGARTNRGAMHRIDVAELELSLSELLQFQLSLEHQRLSQLFNRYYDANLFSLADPNLRAGTLALGQVTPATEQHRGCLPRQIARYFEYISSATTPDDDRKCKTQTSADLVGRTFMAYGVDVFDYRTGINPQPTIYRPSTKTGSGPPMNDPSVNFNFVDHMNNVGSARYIRTGSAADDGRSPPTMADFEGAVSIQRHLSSSTGTAFEESNITSLASELRTHLVPFIEYQKQNRNNPDAPPYQFPDGNVSRIVSLFNTVPNFGFRDVLANQVEDRVRAVFGVIASKGTLSTISNIQPTDVFQSLNAVLQEGADSIVDGVKLSPPILGVGLMDDACDEIKDQMDKMCNIASITSNEEITKIISRPSLSGNVAAAESFALANERNRRFEANSLPASYAPLPGPNMDAIKADLYRNNSAFTGNFQNFLLHVDAYTCQGSSRNGRGASGLYTAAAQETVNETILTMTDSTVSVVDVIGAASRYSIIPSSSATSSDGGIFVPDAADENYARQQISSINSENISRLGSVDHGQTALSLPQVSDEIGVTEVGGTPNNPATLVPSVPTNYVSPLVPQPNSSGLELGPSLIPTGDDNAVAAPLVADSSGNKAMEAELAALRAQIATLRADLARKNEEKNARAASGTVNAVEDASLAQTQSQLAAAYERERRVSSALAASSAPARAPAGIQDTGPAPLSLPSSPTGSASRASVSPRPTLVGGGNSSGGSTSGLFSNSGGTGTAVASSRTLSSFGANEVTYASGQLRNSDGESFDPTNKVILEFSRYLALQSDTVEARNQFYDLLPGTDAKVFYVHLANNTVLEYRAVRANDSVEFVAQDASIVARAVASGEVVPVEAEGEEPGEGRATVRLLDENLNNGTEVE